MKSITANFDKINWSRLFHAYGIAKDTPEHMHNLCSHDFNLREKAIDHLFSAIVHQGTIYSVTPVVVRILIGLPKDPALHEDMYEFYYTKTKLIYEQTVVKLNSPDITPIRKKGLLYLLEALKKQLGVKKTTTVMEMILSFLCYVGESLLHSEKPENHGSISSLDVDNLFDNYDDDFWISPLLETLTKQAIIELYTMAPAVLEAVSCFITDENQDIRLEAVAAAENWDKVMKT